MLRRLSKISNRKGFLLTRLDGAQRLPVLVVRVVVGETVRGKFGADAAG
jgi:hypothetical protein